MAELLIEHGVDVHGKNELGHTPLSMATLLADEAVADLLRRQTAKEPAPPSAECSERLYFRLVGLKELYRVDLCIREPGAVDGNFYVFEYDTDSATSTSAFAGTLDGQVLTVDFAPGTPPYPRSADPAAGSVVRWQLDGEPGSSKTLVFETYGRDYDRNAWSTHFAEMERARLIAGASLEKITADDLEPIDP